MIFDAQWRKEQLIKRQMLATARALTMSQYQKDKDIRQIRASDLTSSALQHLIDGAAYQGSITVKLSDGTEITVDNLNLKEAGDQLRKLSERFDG